MALEPTFNQNLRFSTSIEKHKEKQRFCLPGRTHDEPRWLQDSLRTALGPLWVALGPLLAALGLLLAALGSLLVGLGAFLAALGAVEVALRALLVPLRGSLALPGRSWGAPRGWRPKILGYWDQPRPRDPCPFMYVYIYIYIMNIYLMPGLHR